MASRAAGGARVILITGITSPLGVAVTRRILEQLRGEFDVWGLARRRHVARRTMRAMADLVRICEGDVQDAQFMRRLIDELRPDVVLHLAEANAHDCATITYATNVLGTLNLLEALRFAKLATTRVVVLSSSEVYGDAARASLTPLSETAATVPTSAYGVSKLAVEAMTRQHVTSYGLTVVAARVFEHSGRPSTNAHSLQGLAAQVALIEAGLQPPVLHVPRHAAPLAVSDVHEVADMLLQLMDYGVPGEVYNVAGLRVHTVQDVMDALVAPLNAIGPVTVSVDEKEVAGALADTTKILKVLRSPSTIDVRSTLAQLLESARADLPVERGTAGVVPVMGYNEYAPGMGYTQVAVPTMAANTQLFVKDLPNTAKDEAITSAFARFGQIVNIALSVRGTKRHAVVTYTSPEHVESAIRSGVAIDGMAVHVERLKVHLPTTPDVSAIQMQQQLQQQYSFARMVHGSIPPLIVPQVVPQMPLMPGQLMGYSQPMMVGMPGLQPVNPYANMAGLGASLKNRGMVPPSNTLYVREVPAASTEDGLATFFSQFGQVLNVRIISNGQGAKPYAFVNFVAAEAVDAVLRIHRETPLTLAGLPLILDRHRHARGDSGSNLPSINTLVPPLVSSGSTSSLALSLSHTLSPSESDPMEDSGEAQLRPRPSIATSVFVRDLPVTVNEQSLGRLFQQHGNLVNVRLKTNHKTQEFYAFIDFVSERDVDLVMQAHTERPFTLDGVIITVQRRRHRNASTSPRLGSTGSSVSPQDPNMGNMSLGGVSPTTARAIEA